MLELIQLSVACRGLQYRDIVPVCGSAPPNVSRIRAMEKRERGENDEKGVRW